MGWGYRKSVIEKCTKDKQNSNLFFFCTIRNLRMAENTAALMEARWKRFASTLLFPQKKIQKKPVQTFFLLSFNQVTSNLLHFSFFFTIDEIHFLSGCEKLIRTSNRLNLLSRIILDVLISFISLPFFFYFLQFWNNVAWAELTSFVNDDFWWGIFNRLLVCLMMRIYEEMIKKRDPFGRDSFCFLGRWRWVLSFR